MERVCLHYGFVMFWFLIKVVIMFVVRGMVRDEIKG